MSMVQPSDRAMYAQSSFDYEHLAPEVRTDVQESTRRIHELERRTSESIIEIGQQLIRVKQRLPHGEFLPWLDAEFGWTERTARRFMAVADVFHKSDNLSAFQPSALYALASNNVPQEVRDDFAAVAEAGHPVTHAAVKEAIAERKATPRRPEVVDHDTGEILDTRPAPRPVTPGARDRVTYMLNDPERSQWSDAQVAERCDVPEVFVSVVRRDIEAREKQQEIPAWQPPAPTPKNVHVSNNSGENEWYTPPQFIAAAREVLGEIDLDPASSIKANETVQAQAFFTKDDNGLTKEWHGRVWLNPPYAQPLISEFSEKVVEEYDAARIDAAIVLVNNATETRWFQKMARSATAICFPAGRIKYLDATGTPANTPLQGQAFLYFGADHGKFISVFEQFGVVR